MGWTPPRRGERAKDHVKKDTARQEDLEIGRVLYQKPRVQSFPASRPENRSPLSVPTFYIILV